MKDYTMRFVYALTAALLTMALLGTAWAKDVQWSQGYTGDCTNATEREDGVPLDLSEIYMVRYLIVPQGGDINDATYEIQMMGGCKPVFVDTKRYVPPGTYEVYGLTVDTSQPNRLESVPSDPPVILTVGKSSPKAPSNIQ